MLLSVLAVFICTVTVSVNNNQLITFWTGKKGKRNRWLDKDWTKDWTLIQTYLLRGWAAGGVRWRHTGVRLMSGGGANEGGVVQVWRENRQREEAEEWHMTHEDVNFKIKEEIIKPNHKNHDRRDVWLNLIYRSETPNILCFESILNRLVDFFQLSSMNVWVLSQIPTLLTWNLLLSLFIFLPLEKKTTIQLIRH